MCIGLVCLFCILAYGHTFSRYLSDLQLTQEECSHTSRCPPSSCIMTLQQTSDNPNMQPISLYTKWAYIAVQCGYPVIITKYSTHVHAQQTCVPNKTYEGGGLHCANNFGTTVPKWNQKPDRLLFFCLPAWKKPGASTLKPQ